MLSLPVERKLQFFNELMKNSNVAILVADKNRRNIFVNQRSCEMFGYTEDELIGQSASIFHISEDSYKRFGELILDAVLKGKKVGFDYQWKRKDGSIFWGHIAGSITKESEEVLWTLFDINDRIEAEEIQQRNHEQAQIIEQINEAVVMVDINGIITSWNNGAKILTQYTSEEIIGKSVEMLYLEKDIQNYKESVQNLFKYGHNKRETTLRKKDGSTVEILLSSSVLKNEDGEITHMIGYAQDITLIKKAQKRILQADMFYALVENAFVAIYLVLDGKFIYTNKKFQDIFGYTEEEMQNKDTQDLIYHEDIELVKTNLKERKDTVGLGFEYAFRGLKKSGQILDAHVYGSSLILDENKVAIIGTLTDETEKNIAKKQLEILANQDTLTELFNRNYFNTQLGCTLALAQKENHKLALILFDIDNFKRVNDSLGHLAGDMIIQETAKRISKILRKSDTFFRIGGDEFTIIVENYQNKSELSALVSRISSIMSESIEIENIAFHISLSIGISLFPENAQTTVTLQKTADLAMYEAKSKGKNNSVFYTEDNIERLNKAHLEDELFQAYKNGEFELYLQAQILSKDEKLLGAEALVRWNHPQKGIILPEVFLSLAEEVGLLYKIDLFMLKNALKIIHKYNKSTQETFQISVNISNALFMHQMFISNVEKIVEEYKEDVKYIELELTENITMKNENYSKEVIQKLKFLGFKISIDDFGTGYSSLSHLKMLKINELKIDKSFIDDISTNNTDKSIVKAIVEMSKALSLKSVAEGVESQEQLDILKDMGCNIIQGYYFSKPLSIGEFEDRWFKKINL